MLTYIEIIIWVDKDMDKDTHSHINQLDIITYQCPNSGGSPKPPLKLWRGWVITFYRMDVIWSMS